MKRFPLRAVIIAAASIAAVVLFLERMEQGKPDGKPPPPSATRPSAGKETAGEGMTTPERLRKAPERAAPAKRRQDRPIAIIIDDIGFDLRVVEELSRIPGPIAFAVLPYAPHAAEAARILHSAGKEILLHLPMEPRGYPEESPGPGALMVDMNETEIRERIQRNLAAVPYVSGVNNHMGSRFMEDEAHLAMVMLELKKRGLYFVDSRTTPDTRGRETAKRAGVRFASRNLFIDHLPGYAAALENLTAPFRQAGKKDKPILMIGHPHPETLRALRDALPRWEAEGVRPMALPVFVRLSEEENRNGLAATEKASGRKGNVR